MSFLFEVLFQGVVEAVCEGIAKRFGTAGCLVLTGVIVVVVVLIIWVA